MLQDAFGKAANITYTSEVTAMAPHKFSIENLNPASSYILLISAKNNDARLPRIMRDDVMAKLEIITTAATAPASSSDDDWSSPLLTFAALLYYFFF